MSIEKNDIVQITEVEHPWYPALLIVDEVKVWGVQAYVNIPMSNEDNGLLSQAFNRLENGSFEKVGHCCIIPVE